LTVNAPASIWQASTLFRSCGFAINSPTGVSSEPGDLLDRKRFRMDGSAIQRILAVADAEETNSLIVGFGTDAGDFVELLARAEAAMLVAVSDNIQRDPFGDYGDVTQQRPRGSIEVDADAVDAILDGCLQ
jgi:hypothetical protein